MDRTFDTPGDLDVEIRIGSGTIEIEAGETATTTLAIGGPDPEEFRVDLTDGRDGRHRLVIEQRKRRGSFFGWGRETSIVLRIPRGANVEAGTGSADLSVRGRLGSITFQTGSGDLSFDDADGNVVTKSGSGDVRGRSVGGDLLFNSGSGDVRVGSIGGELIARTASGDVDVRAAGRSIHATSASGDVRIDTASTGEVQVRTVSGDVHIGVTKDTSVWMDLSSVSGDAVCELDATDEPRDGNAALELRLTSVSGEVRVLKATA